MIKSSTAKKVAIVGVLALGVGAFELMADDCDPATTSACSNACSTHGGLVFCTIVANPSFNNGIVECPCGDGSDGGWFYS